MTTLQSFPTAPATWPFDALSAACSLATAVSAAPFDHWRSGYAAAVRAGLLPRSMLASRDLEVALDALEQLTLGPLARRL